MTKQAEKEYLARTGSSAWELVKPFSHPGADTMGDSAQLLHDFSVAMLTLQPEPDDLILDVGAGGCWCSDLLGRLNRRSVAIDISLDMLRTGRSRPGTAIRAVAGDLESLPFRDGTFQKAVCLSAIHHVPDIPAALRELARVLDAGGVAFFSEPGRGHADAAVSTAAMRDFGVLEQDILIADFARACRAAGFADVRVKALGYTIPAFDVTPEEWESWRRLAESKRPRRALAKMRRALLELLGLGKQGELFEETTGVALVRTLRHAMEDHPIIVVAKQAPAARGVASPDGSPWAAALEIAAPDQATAGDSVQLTVTAVNRGTRTWSVASASDIGHVTLGIQLLDAEARLLARDHHRVRLPHAVGPGERVTLTVHCPAPATAGPYRLKADMVAEGITWFETAGSTAASTRLTVRE